MNENETREFMVAEARKTSGDAVGVPARHVKFPLPQNVNRKFFYADNPLASSLFAIFSAIFPPGERFFVETVRRFRNNVKDDILKAKITGFVGQESLHGREHERLNTWFTGQGYDIEFADRAIRFSLGLLENLSPTQQLACTAFMEHFTAHLAEEWLENESFRSEFETTMLGLWSWHGVEELEHKEVAFEVHNEVSPNPYFERLIAGPLVLGALLPGIVLSLGRMVARHGEAFSFKKHIEALATVLKKGGIIRTCLEHLPEFAARDFHPENRDTRAIEAKWRERLFGSEGELVSLLKKKETA